MSITTLVKSIQDIMRQDAGVDGDAQRISAKVDHLMRLCDALEAGLAQAETVRRSVAAAMLQVDRHDLAHSPRGKTL